MKWVDYREKLGIGFNDDKKLQMLKNKMEAFLDEARDWFKEIDVFSYAIMVGEQLPSKKMYEVVGSFNSTTTIAAYISKCVAFYNSCTKHSIYDNNTFKDAKTVFLEFLQKSLKDLSIPFEIVEDSDGIFIFPKGAKELDDALVSEPLEWLKDYPITHKTFVTALKQYSDGIYIRDVADNLRKALEEFLREFLGNKKNLETNKIEICKYLGNRGVDAGISGLYQPLINAYKNINDRTAKHSDAVEKKMLEFLLYQTGLLIRMVISIKTEDDNNAD